MELVVLGRSGGAVSAIGTGTWQAGDDTWGPDVNDRDCIAAIVRATELGMTLVDTAENYGRGHSEEVVGKAIRKAGRERVFVATKVSDHHLRPVDVGKACAASARRLGIRHIDLYQVHWTDPYDQVPLRRTMRAMERLEREGKVEHIGVSNFAVRDLEEARSALSRTDIVSNQVQYNLLHRNIEEEVLPYCRRERISILAYGPRARCFLPRGEPASDSSADRRHGSDREAARQDHGPSGPRVAPIPSGRDSHPGRQATGAGGAERGRSG